jgi:hypothetical protein
VNQRDTPNQDQLRTFLHQLPSIQQASLHALELLPLHLQHLAPDMQLLTLIVQP